MIRPAPTPCTQSLNRVRAWLATSKKSRSQIAKETGVDEKTLRLAAKAGWNPTVKTLQKLEAMVPNGWRHKNGGGK